MHANRHVQRRVNRGIRRLNRVYGPDWPYRIDTAFLDIAYRDACILGQLEGNYDRLALSKLGGLGRVPFLRQSLSAWLGLNNVLWSTQDVPVEISELNMAWKRYIWDYRRQDLTGAVTRVLETADRVLHGQMANRP